VASFSINAPHWLTTANQEFGQQLATALLPTPPSTFSRLSKNTGI
jgi:hypothetical protein